MEFGCNHCGKEFKCNEDDYEEILWGHLQIDHENIFKDYENLDTPDMIEDNYEKLLVTKIFEIQGCFETDYVPEEYKRSDFVHDFISLIESKGWEFKGTVEEYIDK